MKNYNITWFVRSIALCSEYSLYYHPHLYSMKILKPAVLIPAKLDCKQTIFLIVIL